MIFKDIERTIKHAEYTIKKISAWEYNNYYDDYDEYEESKRATMQFAYHEMLGELWKVRNDPRDPEHEMFSLYNMYYDLEEAGVPYEDIFA